MTKRRVVAVRYATDKSHLYFFDPDIRQISDRIKELFPGKGVEIFDESWDQRYYLAHVSSDRDPGAYYHFDVKRSDLTLIARSHPLLEERELAAMTPIHYTARDAVRIPAYLTLPPGDVERPLPAILLPHGGPQSRDVWDFDWLPQFLAARGYAVLQSNFRGSGGYGSSWAGHVDFVLLGFIRDVRNPAAVRREHRTGLVKLRGEKGLRFPLTIKRQHPDVPPGSGIH